MSACVEKTSSQMVPTLAILLTEDHSETWTGCDVPYGAPPAILAP